jgi:hypothetical protein
VRRVVAHLVALVTLTAAAGLSAFVVSAPASAGTVISPPGGTSGRAPLFGASIPSGGDLAQETGQFGHMPIVHVYYNGLPKTNAWTGGLAGANKSAVIVSFNASPSAILSGADDSTLKHFFDTAPTGHPIYYCYIHEPEHHIELGQYSAAAYRSAWTHVAKIAQGAHNPDLRATLILMGYDVQKSSHRNWRDYMPSGGIITTVAWDAYPDGAAPGPTRALVPPGPKFMGPEIAASKAAGLAFGFAEFGATIQNGRGPWLTAVGNYLMTSGAAFACLFDSPLFHFRLTDSASINAWRAVVAKSG